MNSGCCFDEHASRMRAKPGAPRHRSRPTLSHILRGVPAHAFPTCFPPTCTSSRTGHHRRPGFRHGRPGAGKRGELSLYGDISSNDNSDNTYIATSIGFYLTPQAVLKLSYGYQYTYTPSSSETDTTQFGGGLRYYFQVGKRGDLVPFAGANLTLISVSNYDYVNHSSTDSSGTGTEFELGLSYFVSENASFDVRAYMNSVDFDGNSVDTTGVSIGTTIRF